MFTEKELERVWGLLHEYCPEIRAKKVGIDFGTQRGFGIRLHPLGHTGSFLFFHNGSEWQSRLENGSTKTSGMGCDSHELVGAVAGMLFLIGVTSRGHRALALFPGGAKLNREKEVTLNNCRRALFKLATDSNLEKSERLLASEFIRELG
jgi:hypothetical protein